MSTTGTIKWKDVNRKVAIVDRAKFGVVMQVKDEADIIGATVARWLSLGAEKVFVIDDGSTDMTEKAISFVADALWPGRVIQAITHENPYEMQRHINWMKTMFVENFNINWIIPADADEIWHFPNNDPGAFFASLPQTPSWGEVPYFDNFPNGVRKIHPTHKKCFGYLTQEMEVSIGNHLILDGDRWPKIQNHGVYIEHYPVRTYEQMRTKLINHMTAYKQQHPEHYHGQNWHEWQRDGEAFFERKWKEFNPEQ